MAPETGNETKKWFHSFYSTYPRDSSKYNKERRKKKVKCLIIEKEKNTYLKILLLCTQKIHKIYEQLELRIGLSKMTGYKVNIKKSILFPHARNK